MQGIDEQIPEGGGDQNRNQWDLLPGQYDLPAGFVGTFELVMVEECVGTVALRCVDDTVGGGHEAAGGVGAKNVGFGASQVPSGTRDTAAVLQNAAERTVGAY